MNNKIPFGNTKEGLNVFFDKDGLDVFCARVAKRKQLAENLYDEMQKRTAANKEPLKVSCSGLTSNE